MSCCDGPKKVVQISSCGDIKCPAPIITTCGDSGFKQLIRNLKAAVTISNSWNIPGCGLTAVIYTDINSVPVGSFLWSSLYGYFEVVSFDPITKKAVIINSCDKGEQSIGLNVPKCSTFILVSEPGLLTSSSVVYLASDFIAPAIDSCVIVSVTSALLLVEGSNIQVGSAVYFLNSILDGTTIRICNTGGGFTVGTQVKAFNAVGQYQYKISTLGSSFIAEDSATAGPLTLDSLIVEKIFVVASLGILNPSPSRNSLVFWTSVASVKGNAINTNTGLLAVRHIIAAEEPGGTIQRQGTEAIYSESDLARATYEQSVLRGVFVLPPGGSHILETSYIYNIDSFSFVPAPSIEDTVATIKLSVLQNIT